MSGQITTINVEPDGPVIVSGGAVVDAGREAKRRRKAAKRLAKAQARARAIQAGQDAHAEAMRKRRERLAALDVYIARMREQTRAQAEAEARRASAPLGHLSGGGPLMKAVRPGGPALAATPIASAPEPDPPQRERWDPPRMQFQAGRGWVVTRPGRWIPC